MKKSIRIGLSFTALLLFICGVAVAPSAAEMKRPEKVTVRASGGPTGTGKDLAIQFPAEAIRRENPGWTVEVINGPTSLTEVAMLGQGLLDFTRLGAGDIHTVKKGYYGKKKLPQPVDLRWLAPSTVQVNSLYMLKKIPINSLAELKDKRYPIKISIGRKGSGPYNYSQLVLEAFGVSPEDIRKWGGKILYQASKRSSELMGDGLAEAFITVGTLPDAGFTELSRKRELKIAFSSQPEIQAKLMKKGFIRVPISKGVYSFVHEDAESMGMATVIVVNASMEENVVYHMTRAIWEQREFLHSVHPLFKKYLRPEIVTSWGKQFRDLLHPGAAQYYEDIGLLE